MLFDAIDRVTRIADQVDGVGLVVNAKQDAIHFYQRYGFEQMAIIPRICFCQYDPTPAAIGCGESRPI